MKAVIMAGGEGSRLRPLTCNLPKPMVPIVNRPMMEHIVNLLKAHNISEIASTLWYLPQDVMAYFGDGSAFGVSMEYFVEKEPLGTAGSVKNAAGFLDDTFVVVSGDSLTDIDLSAAVAFHRERNAVATLILTRVANPLNYGIVITGEDGRIRQFLEKPSWSEVFSDTVNTGIYVLEPEVLQEFAEGQKFDFSRDLFPLLLAKKAPIFGYVAEGYWSDVGNLEVYRQAQQDCLEGRVRIDLGRPRKDGIYAAEDAAIAPDAEITAPVYIGPGAHVASGARVGKYSVIGPNCRIEAGASLKRAVLWHGVHVGEGSELRGCVLAKNIRIGSRAKLFEGAVIGENAHIGAYSTVRPNVKVWPEKRLTSGTILKQSLVWGCQERPSLFSKWGITGDLRGDLPLEEVIRVGLSCGAFLGAGSKVLVTADGTPNARVAKRALIAGLLNGGLHVLDAGTAAANLTRLGSLVFGTQAALHCQSFPRREGIVNIQCWDQAGRFFSKSDQRKLENIFLREDYPRLSGSELGELTFVTGLSDRYVDILAKAYRAGRPGYRVALKVSSPEAQVFAGLVREFLARAGYELANPGEGSQVTIVVDDSGWYMQDESGQRFTEAAWWTLFVHSLRAKARRGIAVPVHVSEQVSRAAQEAGLDVRWTRLEPQFWMEAASEMGITEGDEVELFPYIEPLASMGEVLRFASSTQERLADLLEASKTHTRSKLVFCPWKDKGRVMRELISQTQPENTLYLDGIKTYTGTGWALVVPDGDEPLFQILSEAASPEEADALVEHYAAMISSQIDEE
mgnify:CR=1 FL=1